MNDKPAPPSLKRTLILEPDPAGWADAPVLVMTACDSRYLGHALALARSMDAFSGPAHLLLHLVNPDAGDLARVEQVAEDLQSLKLHVSAEQVKVPAGSSLSAYYASARFLRMAELLDDPGHCVPLFALDADALAVGPLKLDFSDKPEAEICLRRRDLAGDDMPDHLRIAAGAIWVDCTPAARVFMRAVADDLIAAFVSRSAEWFIDQVVLHSHVTAESGGAQVRNLKTKFCDWSMLEDAVFWTGKGYRKYLDVRYLLVREAFDDDRRRRDVARALYAATTALVPADERQKVEGRIARVLAEAREVRTGIFLPRLDLPWKREAMDRHGAVPAQQVDVVELRLWWKRFAMELARILTAASANPRIIELPAWEITAERVDAEDLDLAFVPHRCRPFDFDATGTPVRFFMQEYFRPVFVVDAKGWSAGSSVYPVDANALPPAVLGAWDDYRAAFASGGLDSKFDQSPAMDRAALVAAGMLPEGKFLFFPLQIPHDQSITYFSDVSLDEALEQALELARSEGLELVLKEHPANRGAMRPYREKYRDAPVFWSDAHLHDLLRNCLGVVTINSGAGFEALLAGRPVVCLGRAEYDAAAHRVGPEGLRAAWRAAVAEPAEDRLRRYARFVDWFLARHAVDLSRPLTARHVLDRHVQEALAEVRARRKPGP